MEFFRFDPLKCEPELISTGDTATSKPAGAKFLCDGEHARMIQSNTINWPAGDGAMSACIRAWNWSATCLGPIETWPQSLKSTVDILLRLPMPAVLSWGKDGVMIYNDACSELAETFHPHPLGSKLDHIGPANEDFKDSMRKVRQELASFVRPDQEFTLRHNGRARHAWFSVNYSPVPDEQGNTAGTLALFIETTERVQAEQALRESEQRLSAIFARAQVGLSVLSPEGRFLRVNDELCRMLARPRETLLTLGIQDVTHRDDVDNSLKAIDHLLATGQSVSVDKRYMRPDGTLVFANSSISRLDDADGQGYAVLAVTVDLTERKRTQEELMISNERLNLAIEGSGDGVWDWNTQTNEIVYSKRTRDILGLGEQEVLHRYEEWEARVHPDDLPALRARLRDCLDGKTPSFSMEHRIRWHDGSWRWVLARAIVVRRDEHNQPLRMTGTVTDIAEKRRSEEIVWRHANFDVLTDLPNRRLFRDRLDHEVRKAHRTGQPLALLFIDLDHFKETNDLLGHDIGDQVLIEAARRICNCVRQSDTVARLGGDEFTAILTELDDLAHVEPVAQKINDALSTPFHIDNEVVFLSASIGITLYPNDATTAEHLIRNADQAMYVAKTGGRNQFSYFTPSMQREAHDRLHLISDLRSALGRGQLKVYYQPVIDLATGRVVKAEALLRWQHPRLGMIEPIRFISFAEESGLIIEIGDWVFREAAGRSRQWSQHLGAPFQISINRSPVQFLSRAKEVNWPAHLRDLGLSGSSVSVEITEGMLLNASPAVVAQLLQYRDAGIQVAIDDFGTGYSSMAYLKKFDIDYLKIDQSFIRDMATHDGDRAIVRSVTAMAHELGMQVIAEGIETSEQQRLLIDAQCDFGQGFLFSKALPAEEFEHMLFTHGSVPHS